MKYSDLENEWLRGWYQLIRDNPDKEWDWYCLSDNPNITWEIIQQNPDKDWDWKALSINWMSKGKQQWINNRRLYNIKALQIQRHWRNCSCNPEYKLAQRCLLRVHGS